METYLIIQLLHIADFSEHWKGRTKFDWISSWTLNGALTDGGAMHEDYKGNIEPATAEPDITKFIEGPIWWATTEEGGGGHLVVMVQIIMRMSVSYEFNKLCNSMRSSYVYNCLCDVF